MDKSIKLSDGTELIPLEAQEKEALEAEIKVVLDKYNASYLPVIQKVETLSEIKQAAGLFLLKKKPQEILSDNPEVNPTLNGESNDTTEEDTDSKTEEGS